jgi:hypothetical protein
MLDVHPPHHPTHTWRDFFIHIATIVVGLIIAVGLEQLVERIHQHYELRETREALQRELESNHTNIASDERDWLITTARLKNNLLVLQFIRSHPGTPQTGLPGDLDWHQSPFHADHAVWDAAEKSGITAHMPLTESNRDVELYNNLTGLGAQSLDTWNAINDAARARHIEMGYSFGRLAFEFPDMPQYITWKNIGTIRPTSHELDPKGLAAAHQLTQNRIHAAVANIPTPR